MKKTPGREVYRKGMRKMKKLLMLLCALLIVPAAVACAEEAETVTFGMVTVQADAAYVDMGEQVVEDWEAYYGFLSQLPQVEQVDMFATIVEKKEITQLESRFPNVKFGWTIHLTRDHYVRTDQTAFSTLHGSCSEHTSKELELLKYCTEMLALDIGHNDLTDISFLQYMPKLRVLILACNPRLRNIEVLSQLKDLEYVELFSCNITNITPLTGLERLLDLNVSYNNITRYAGLNDMKQLQRLWIPQSGVPCYGDEFKQLAADLPNTTIMNKGHPTNYGWREGNHYETIYTMFRADEYIPFVDSYPIEGVAAPLTTPVDTGSGT